jgi:hypothetical protein
VPPRGMYPDQVLAVVALSVRMMPWPDSVLFESVAGVIYLYSLTPCGQSDLSKSHLQCGLVRIRYDELMFRDDLKKLYNMLGAENKRVVFLFTDSHVADEGFLELINNMLTSGMVPALYADDEKDALINQVCSQ